MRPVVGTKQKSNILHEPLTMPFLYFLEDRAAELKQTKRNISGVETLGVLAYQWDAMNNEQKDIYVKKYQQSLKAHQDYIEDQIAGIREEIEQKKKKNQIQHKLEDTLDHQPQKTTSQDHSYSQIKYELEQKQNSKQYSSDSESVQEVDQDVQLIKPFQDEEAQEQEIPFEKVPKKRAKSQAEQQNNIQEEKKTSETKSVLIKREHKNKSSTVPKQNSTLEKRELSKDIKSQNEQQIKKEKPQVARKQSKGMNKKLLGNKKSEAELAKQIDSDLDQTHGIISYKQLTLAKLIKQYERAIEIDKQ